MIDLALSLCFPLLSVYAAVNDVVTQRIPNWLCLGLVIGFVCVGAYVALPLATWLVHFAIAAAILCIAMALFALRIIGGGDAKFLAATSLWMGWPAVQLYLLYVLLLAALLAVVMSYWRQYRLSGFFRLDMLAKWHDHHSGMPLAVAITCAALLVYDPSKWFG